jgi:hypothetical protein
MIRSVYIWIALLQYCFAFSPSPFTTVGRRSHSANTKCVNSVVKTDPAHSNKSVFGRRDQCTNTIFYAFNGDTNNENEYLDEETIDTTTTGSQSINAKGGDVGEFSKEDQLGLERETAVVGDPQVAQLETMNITKVLTELQAIQSQGPKKYCILGTRHCSFLHQQIVEML